MSHLPNNIVSDSIALGKLIFLFGRTMRGTYHDDGKTKESDTDHTVMLGILACAFANRFIPQLDNGAIAQFVFVHDLVEAYAGDTSTLCILSSTQKAEKNEREKIALGRIIAEFGDVFPWIHKTIENYESLNTPEARFVKALDKVVPKITHILNRGVAIRSLGHDKQVTEQIYENQKTVMENEYAHDLPEVMELREMLLSEMYKKVFP